MNSQRDRIVAFLDAPKSVAARLYLILLIFLVYVSICILVLETKYPELIIRHSLLFTSIEYLVLTVFALDLMLRLVVYHRRLAYLSSWAGIVDVLAIAPSIVAVVTALPSDALWVRALRLFRFIRHIKLVRSARGFAGITVRLMPFLGAAIAAKALVLILETKGWWPQIGGLGVVVGVVGFTLAILLGTKLSIINGRLYSIEDAVCRIVGALRILRLPASTRDQVEDWALKFERLLRSPGNADVAQMRADTDRLAEVIGESIENAPNVSGFHRDVAYVLHRATARIPVVYEGFLRSITITYGVVVLLAIPGITGFFASVIVVYVIGGAYVLIEDMDRPFGFNNPESFIDVDLSPLSEFNQRITNQNQQNQSKIRS